MLFDLGGVVVDVDPGSSPLIDLGLKDAMDVGRIGGEEALARTGQDPAGVLAAWNAMLRVRPEVVALIRRLSVEVRCAVLSNTDPLHAAWIQSATALDGAISAWVFSFELGLLKPDPAIWAPTLERLDAVAPEVVLVDDRADNLQSAIDAGLGGVLYTTFDDVCAALRDFGLPS